MAPEEVEKPTEAKPEEVPASAEATEGEPAPAAASEPAVAAEPAAAAPPTPPADPVKQMGDAAQQVSASVDKAFSGVPPQNRVLIVAIVSIFFSGGVGAILNAQVMKGVAILVVACVLFFAGPFTFMFSWLLLGLLHVLVVIDAIVIASRMSKGEKFADWDFFWKPAPTA